MSPSPDQMSQICAPSYSNPPFLGMVSNPWNPTFPIQVGLVLNQVPTSQPSSLTTEVPTYEPIQSMPQPIQFLSQVSQLVQVVLRTKIIL